VVREALHHAALSVGIEVQIEWVHSAELEKGRGWEGCLPRMGSSCRADLEVEVLKAKSRQPGMPAKIRSLSGALSGMQLMVIEFARYVLGNDETNSTEFDRSTPHPVIDLMPDQRDIADMGGTMRLGLYPCELQRVREHAWLTKRNLFQERHRHRFEFNNAYREILQAAGMQFSGLSPDGRLVEIAEMAIILL